MTNQKENRVADNCNAVLVRSEADSNRCTRFCRPLPSHSAIRPLFPRICPLPRPISKSGPENANAQFRTHRECKYTNISNFCKTSAQLCVISRRNSHYFPKFVTFTHRKKRHSIRVHDHRGYCPSNDSGHRSERRRASAGAVRRCAERLRGHRRRTDRQSGTAARSGAADRPPEGLFRG